MVVIGLFSPHKYKLATYKKYNIKILEQCFIGVFILKSRFGSSDMMIPTGFYGDCSHYADMPKPDEIFDWERFTSPNWLLAQPNESDNIASDVEVVDNNSNFTFTL